MPVTLEALFEELDSVIVPNATHTAHPRFLPYVQPSPNGISPYAETVEQCVVRWLAQFVGADSTAWRRTAAMSFRHSAWWPSLER